MWSETSILLQDRGFRPTKSGLGLFSHDLDLGVVSPSLGLEKLSAYYQLDVWHWHQCS